MIDYSIIGSRIRQYRLERNLTQEELAFRVNTSAAYISNIERGIKKPSLEKLSEIAEVMNVTVNDFIYTVTFANGLPVDRELSSTLSMCTPEKQQVVFKCITDILNTIISE